MDVRCDRCATEYELDDAIVTDAGASVQCTTCGHTFIVTRSPSVPLPTVGMTPPAGSVDAVGPDVPDWTLSADDGKVHRFRDLNTLQKWIVERKVTRSDRISRSGGPWLALGDVVELGPFFNVVDQADRAQSTTGSSAPSPGAVSAVRSRTASGQFRSMSTVTPPPVPIEARRSLSEDGPTVPNRLLPGFVANATAVDTSRSAVRGSQPRLPGTSNPDDRAPVGAVGSETGAARHVPGAPRAPARTELVFGRNITEESLALEADFLRPSNRGRNVLIGLTLVLLSAGGGYWWWTKQPGQEPASSQVASPAPAVRGDLPGPAAKNSAVPPARAENAEKATPMGGGGDGKNADGTEISMAAAAAAVSGVAGNSGTAAVRGGGAPAPSPRAGRGPTDTGSGRAGSYDRLVADADRLLDHGKSAKADKLFAQALAARPDGVAALTGSAYVLLDRQRHFKAIETFRRALAIEPGYGPALFGIAESYRARGDAAPALAAYRQYLAVAPSGGDAPAARRQIKELESSAAPPSVNQRSSAETPASADQAPK